MFIAIVMAMEVPRRGIVIGTGKSFPCIGRECSSACFEFLRKYHSYAIAYAIIFNYHYHTIEATQAFLGGYFYQYLLMSQTCFLYHKAHRNRYWTFILETAVLLHAILI